MRQSQPDENTAGRALTLINVHLRKEMQVYEKCKLSCTNEYKSCTSSWQKLGLNHVTELCINPASAACHESLSHPGAEWQKTWAALLLSFKGPLKSGEAVLTWAALLLSFKGPLKEWGGSIDKTWSVSRWYQHASSVRQRQLCQAAICGVDTAPAAAAA